MEVKKGLKWYKVLKRFGIRILVLEPRTLFKAEKIEWHDLSDYEAQR